MKFFLNTIFLLLSVFSLSGWQSPENVQAQNQQDDSPVIHAIEQENEKKKVGGDGWSMSQPVHIEADRMLSDQRDNMVVFTGNVVAVQGTLTINSEKMTVYHESNFGGNTSRTDTGEGQQIDRIVATGEVKITRGNLTATGEKVIFEISNEKIFISGNAKVWHQDNLVQGEKVVFDLTEGTTFFESGDQEGKRVKAFFYPEED